MSPTGQIKWNWELQFLTWQVIIIINNVFNYLLLPSVISYTGYRWDWNIQQCFFILALRYLPTNSRATTACMVNLWSEASQHLPVDKKLNAIGIDVVHPSIICYPLIGVSCRSLSQRPSGQRQGYTWTVTSPAQDTYALRGRGQLESPVSLMFFGLWEETWTQKDPNPTFKPRTFLPIDEKYF